MRVGARAVSEVAQLPRRVRQLRPDAPARACSATASGSTTTTSRAWPRPASAAAICPTSNLFLGSGLFDFEKADAARVPLSLATDVGGGTSFSMLQTMNEAYKVARMKGSYLPAAAHVLPRHAGRCAQHATRRHDRQLRAGRRGGLHRARSEVARRCWRAARSDAPISRNCCSRWRCWATTARSRRPTPPGTRYTSACLHNFWQFHIPREEQCTSN